MYKDVICERVDLCRDNSYPYQICEFEHSYFVLNEEQFYKGYSLLYFKDHVRELHDLPRDIHREFSDEIYLASRAINLAFSPWKMNIQSIGNKTPHIHIHLIPRYKEDPFHKELPFFNCIKDDIDLSTFAIGSDQAKTLILEIKKHL